MSFKEAIQTGFNKYAVSEGRARRSEYWYWGLFYTLVMFVVYLLRAFLGETSLIGNVLYWVVLLAVAAPTFCMAVRRMHDIGKSGWGILISLIPLVGPFIYLAWCIRDSQPGENAYGPNPKEEKTAEQL